MLVKILRGWFPKLIILGILCVGLVNNCFGATYTYIGATNGSWNVNANWSGGANYPGFAAGDNAIINSNVNVNLNSALPNAISTLVLNSNFTASITISATFTLAVSGTVTVGAGSAANLTITGAGAETMSGLTLGYQSTFTIGSAGVTTTNVTLNSGSTLAMNQNNNAFTNYGTFTTTSCTLSLSGGPANFTNAGTVNLNSSTALTISNNNSTITNSGTLNINSSTITLSGLPNPFNNSGTVNLNASSTISVTNNNTYLTNTGTFNSTSATFSFSSSAGTAGINNNSPGVFTATSTTFSFLAGSGNSINNTSTFTATLCPITLGGGPSSIYNTGGTFKANGCTLSMSQSSGITNTGACTLDASGATPTTVNFAYGAFIANTGTFNAGMPNSQCILNVTSQTAYINNSSAAGKFYLGSTSIIYLTGISSNVTNTSPGVFTLQSDQNGSAAIGALAASAACTGTFNVERFFQGGVTKSGTRWVYRNYRIISSPVNTGTPSGGNNIYGLNYIVGATAGLTTTANSTTNAFVTGATGGSTVAGNPSLFLYRENKAPSNASFTSGNFIGITNITTPSALVTTDGGTSTIPVGNGVFFFFRGQASSFATRTTAPYIAPENTTLTSTGTLNQQQVTVNDWFTPGSGSLSYTNATANAAVRGFNMVGNPYACSIDWNTAFSGTGITRTNVNPTIWVFNPVTNQYDTYITNSAATGTSNGGGTDGAGNATNIIASGQGFFVQAVPGGASLVFNEAAKSPTSQVTGNSLLLGAPPVQYAAQLLRLRMVQDSINHDDITIGFNSTASPKYNGVEDAEYLPGFNAAEGLSSLSADSIPVLLSINFLPLPKLTTQVIGLKVTAAKSGAFTLQRTQLDPIPQIYQVWLMDKYKKDSLDIRNNTAYVFNIDLTDTASFGSNRFAIIIRQNPALGLHLLDFTATKAGAGVQIVWKTENEQNYTNFTVERSTDNGVTFNVLGGFLSNASGTYSFMDQNPFKAVDEYRLKLEDLNGVITYSNVVTLTYSNSDNSLVNNMSVYPNPASNVINVAILSDNSIPPGISALQSLDLNPDLATANQGHTFTSYEIKIIDITGYVIKAVISPTANWQDNISSLIPGSYIIQVVNNSDKSLVGKTIFVKY